MKKFVLFQIILLSLFFSLAAESVYSIGTNYIIFNEYSTYKNTKTDSHMNGFGFDFSYRHFSLSSEDSTDFVINADDGSIVYTNETNFQLGFWYSLNLNFPLSTKINMNGTLLELNRKDNLFWALIMDNICGVTCQFNFSKNFAADISVGPKIGFFYIDYDKLTNLTLGVAMELGGRVYFKNSKINRHNMGFGFGSKVSYDFYSIAQAYYPQDYSDYGVFSITPFVSFMLKK